MSEMFIEYVPLSQIERWPRNPQDHDLPEIKRSIERFGFVRSLLIDERSGKLVAGHGRVDSLTEMKAAGKTAPQGIRVVGDEWMVPVERGVSFNSDAEVEAFLLADNQLTMRGGWDEPMLAEILLDLQNQGGEALAGVGFDSAFVQALIARNVTPTEEFKAYDESVANDVELITCPNCGAQIPK